MLAPSGQHSLSTFPVANHRHEWGKEFQHSACGTVEGKAVPVYWTVLKVKVRKREIRSAGVPFKSGRARRINMPLNDEGCNLKAQC